MMVSHWCFAPGSLFYDSGLADVHHFWMRNLSSQRGRWSRKFWTMDPGTRQRLEMLGAAPTPWLRPQMGFPASPWGLLRHFLTLHLLRLGSAQFRVVGPGQPLLATVGQVVVLPCHLSPRVDARSWEIRWIRHLVSETVHLYQNGADQLQEQMEEYAGRTELARDGVSRGSLDLRISGLRPSDDGQYVCTVQDAASYGEAVVELKVAAMGSVPLFSLEAYEDGGIRVVCQSAGWYPPPEVLWKDASGQHLPSVSQRCSPDERGLFEIQDVIVVSGKGDGNVSCVVRNSRLEQEQESSLHISAPFFHSALPWMAALGVLLLLLVLLIALSAYLFRSKGKRESDLGNRESDLERRDAALRKRESDLERRDAALRKRESDLEKRAAALEQRPAALERRKFLLRQNRGMETLEPNTSHYEHVPLKPLRPETQNLPDPTKRFGYSPSSSGRPGSYWTAHRGW